MPMRSKQQRFSAAKRGRVYVMGTSFQRGQALIEFLYVSLAMVPLFLLLPMIGKYQDVAHATQMASRYAAFDSIAHHAGTAAGQKTPQVMANEIRQRFFGQSHALIQASDAQTSTLPFNPIWQTPFGQPLIAAPKDVEVTSTAGISESDRSIFNQQGTTGAGLANRMQLPGDGLLRADVSVQLANLPGHLAMIKPFDAIDLSISRRTVFLHGTWAANGPAMVEQRAASLVPVAEGLRNIESTLNTLVRGVDMGRSGPRFNRLDMWRDMVPSDRIKP